jgi:hypothetical protein
MVSGAVLYNFNPNPEELEILLKKLAPLVYVCFFTITGATLELDMLAKAMVLSIILCITRIAGIFAGSFLGGIAAGEDRTHCNVAWMAYITQAGVTLGLAKQIQLLYPGWGSYFATMIVAVVICNQLLGPPLLRFVLRFVGDAKKRQVGKVDGLQAMLLGNFDVCESAIQRLECCGWKVFHFDLATVHAASETMKEEEEVEEVEAEVHGLLSKHEPLDCVIVMMRTDEDNFHIIRALAKACHQMKRISVLRVVVHVVGKSNNSGDENMKWSTKFAEMPSTEAYGDTIDVIVVDRSEATDMLIELAACGKVINSTAILPADTTLDVNPKSIMRRPNPVALSLQEDMVPMDVSDGIDQPTTAESRKSFRRKIRHMMLV